MSDYITFADHEKALFWAYEKNGGLIPSNFKMKSNKKVWFLCPNKNCNHYFRSSPKSICEGRWCPYCAYPCNTICYSDGCKPCFSKSFASHPASKRWSARNETTPRHIFIYTSRKYWFTCEDCGHDYYSILSKISRGSQCTFCVKSILCSDITCQHCFNKSFASHEKSEFWITEKNIKTPRDVAKISAKKYWFRCPDCGHEFETKVGGVTNYDYWCHYCSGSRLCSDDQCVRCHNLSMASHETSVYWSSKNKLPPRQVFKKSSTKCFFDCPCGHLIYMTPLSISRGSWCAYCCNVSSTLCDDINCQRCFERSFSSHPKVEFWSEDNEMNPRDVFKGSTQKAFFNCDKNPKHKFRMALSAVNSGQWCPLCKKKMEGKLWEMLSEYYTVLRQVKFDWCRGEKGYMLPFDFQIEGTKILIELDGDQHFKQVHNWQSYEYTQSIDKYKMFKAYEKDFCIIRITWDTVYYDRWDWFSYLCKQIDDMIITGGGCLGAYICDKREYGTY